MGLKKIKPKSFEIAISFFLLFSIPGQAQFSKNNFLRDSIDFNSTENSYKKKTFPSIVDKVTSNKAFQMTYIGVPLIVGGLIVKNEDDKFHNLRNSYIPNFDNHYDDYMQYSPMIAMFGLKACGVDSYTSWPRMLLADVFSAAIMATTVNSLKYSCKVVRPDNSNRKSFPSGHTAVAFMGATMLHKEYGMTRSPWYSVAGYSVATATALSRIMNNKHWLSDVMVGAGIGILSTEVGYLLADLIFKDKGITHDLLSNQSFDYNKNPSFFGLNIGFNFMPVHFSLSPNIKMKASPGSNVAIEGAWFANRHWGWGGKIAATYMPLSLVHEIPDLEISDKKYHIYGAESDPMNMISVHAGPYFSVPLIDRCLINFKIHPTVNYIFSNDISIYASEVTSKNDIKKYEFLHSYGRFNMGCNFGGSIKYIINPQLAFRVYGEYNIMAACFKTDYSHDIPFTHKYKTDKYLQTFTLGAGIDIMLWK